jgi:uncharacterized cofD-like protein
LFTSVIPNLLVDGIPQAIAASRARKAYFMNLMTQPGETTNFTASDHARAVLCHAGDTARHLIDACVVNTRAFSQRALESYRKQSAQPVEVDFDALKRLGLKVVATDLLRMYSRQAAGKIRHDAGALGAVAIEMAQQGRRARRRLAS